MLYDFSEDCSTDAAGCVTDLVENLIELENKGSLTDEDVDECIYYLQKIAEIGGFEVDFNIFNDEYVKR